MIRVLLCICLLAFQGLSVAQSMPQSVSLEALNQILTNRDAPYDEQLRQLDTLAAAAQLADAHALLVSTQAYRTLLINQHAPNQDVLAQQPALLVEAIRAQDYRAQAHLLRARLHDPKLASAAQKRERSRLQQQLLNLLDRRLAYSEKSAILLDLAAAEARIGQSLSALYYYQKLLNSPELVSKDSVWQQAQQGLCEQLVGLGWYARAAFELQTLLSALSGAELTQVIPVHLQLSEVLFAQRKWSELEALALEIIKQATDIEHLEFQREAGWLLVKVNLAQQKYTLAQRWLEQIEQLGVSADWPARAQYILAKAELALAVGNNILADQQLELVASNPVWLERHSVDFWRLRVVLATELQQLETLSNATAQLLQAIDERDAQVRKTWTDDLAADFIQLRQALEEESTALNARVEQLDASLKSESTFVTLLLLLVAALLCVVGVVSYLYLRVKASKKGRTRRSRSSSSSTSR